MSSRAKTLLLGCCALVVGAAGGALAADPPTAERVALGESVNAHGARGRTLGLSRVSVPPHVRLTKHRHPGTQVAYLQSGSLTYTVYRGEVVVRRGPAGDARVVRRIKAGQRGRISAGDWIVEEPTDVHSAANPGDSRTVIYLSTLFPNGDPPSFPVE